MQRHKSSLQKKAKRQNQVVGSGPDWIKVQSGTSGEIYRLFVHEENGRPAVTCTCRWAEYHDTRFRPCSHAITALDWLERQEGRTISVWETPEDAARQHKSTERIGLGLWATSRKLTR